MVKPPPINGALGPGGGKDPKFRKYLLWLYIFPYGLNEVRMRNLSVRLEN